MKTEFEKAWLFACRVLTFRRRTRHELEKRLGQKGFSAGVAGHVLDMLAEYGYIDDNIFACRWVEQRLGKKGIRGLKRELMEKGIRGEIVNEALGGLECDAEYGAALELIKKKLARRDEAYSLSRLAGLLNRRGFSSEVIGRVCRTMRDGWEDRF
ncbi:MAG: Regulatory protein RecX [Pelotomaculum sp. PtaU1.Bin035]|nr:MAG: Regulatory protein RecX [Pelotomaculum sp. PtaU1.Bin035]